jgi:hypothetical protein
MSVATLESIRDRCYTLVESLTPTSLNRDKFRRYRNEEGADFMDWAEKKPDAAFRRFQIREVSDDEPPQVSDTVYERRRATLQITIAYPQTARTGRNNAMDRDDVMNEDWLEVDYNVGYASRRNFYATHDCTPLGATRSFERGQKCDFLIIRASFEYLRRLTVSAGLIGGPPMPVIVSYTATGSEGTDFTVSIGSSMPDANYKLSWSTEGVTNLPILDCPTANGDRTASTFRVTPAAALTAGDKLVFFLFEAS